MNIAFVLLTHNPDEPAGIERSVAALADGLRELGHRAFVLAAGPPTPEDGEDLVRLTSLSLACPAVEDDLTALLADPRPVCDEVRQILATRRVDAVCWVDAVWGLGYLSPALGGTTTVLMVHVPRTDTPLLQSLEHAAGVVTVSPFMVRVMAEQGVDTSSWQVVPNALLHEVTGPSPAEREELRRRGPVRIVARAEPHKGIAELLRAFPAGLGRAVEIVLAEAGFEYWPGMQQEVIAECRALAAALPGVELLPGMPWQEVPRFLAGAAVTVVSSTSPETFGNVAAEALSVGTPVVGYGLGNLPDLVGTAGRMTDLADGPDRLWADTAGLLADRAGYHTASAEGPRRVAGHRPAAVASAFLDVITRARR
ncbi:glycosyltransferase family 4 protein [Streptomyces katsurahamanus]|uniref:Glycosyltransferase family 4 protein n=1 Tax=Streptomyces katsurahamanus TaxID=2577098 RepID=A0ABW9NYF9_9ACTN|nr:glycosyltransferase family 4 protein [Streptomyces katsurahamanus]MQS38305.1 glycosyltransferase family 4 protein [Streptomyces katsurahamanus]